MDNRMTIGETYDKLLEVLEAGFKAFTRESILAISYFKKGIPTENLELINSILNQNEQTILCFKQLGEEIEFIDEGAAERFTNWINLTLDNVTRDRETLATLKTINDSLISKSQMINKDKTFTIILSDDKCRVEFHCPDLKENGIVPMMPLVIGADRMSLTSNIPAIVDHVKQMMIKEEYNTVLFERNDLAIYNELAVEIRNIPELVFMESDSDH